MIIYWKKRKFIYKKSVQFSQGYHGTPTWTPTWESALDVYIVIIETLLILKELLSAPCLAATPPTIM